MQNNIEDVNRQTNDDYKISSSLKTLWNDVSGGTSTSSNHNVHSSLTDTEVGGHNITQTSQSTVQQVNNVALVGNEIQFKTFGPASDNATVINLNVNSLKGRAITARNGSYTSNVLVDNGNRNQVISFSSDW